MTGHPPTRPIGRTGLRVPEIGLGAAPLGNLYAPLPEPVAQATLAAALAGGIGYVDTAPFYGFGLSERRVGDSVRGTGALVSTKIGRVLDPDPSVVDDRERHGFRSAMPFRPRFDYSGDGVLRSVEASLQRLGLARVDMLFVHDIGRLTHGAAHEHHLQALLDGGWRALEDLRATGVTRAIGIGVNEVEVAEALLDRVPLDAVLLAGRYTLLDQSALAGLLPRCAAVGTSVVIGGPYNSGILATGTGGPAAHFDYAPAPPAMVARARRLEAACARHGVPLRAAALRFPLAHRAVASVVPGIDSPERVADTLALHRWPIPSDLWAELKSDGLLPAEAPTP